MTTPAPRSRARTLLPLAVAAWVLLEIWLLIVVARAAGGFTVLLLLLAGLVLGALAVKRAGRAAWRNLTASMQPQPQPPAGDAPEGIREGTGLAMLGGLLLMIPGLLSDAAGLLCLFPPTRSLLRRAFGRGLTRRGATQGTPGSLGDLFQQARTADEQLRIHRPDGKVIQGEVLDRGEPAGEPTDADGKNPGSRRR